MLNFSDHALSQELARRIKARAAGAGLLCDLPPATRPRTPASCGQPAAIRGWTPSAVPAAFRGGRERPRDPRLQPLCASEGLAPPADTRATRRPHVRARRALDTQSEQRGICVIFSSIPSVSPPQRVYP